METLENHREFYDSVVSLVCLPVRTGVTGTVNALCLHGRFKLQWQFR